MDNNNNNELMPKAESKFRLTVWMCQEHKDYIEDVSYASHKLQRDVLYKIIQEYIDAHPITPLRSTGQTEQSVL